MTHDCQQIKQDSANLSNIKMMEWECDFLSKLGLLVPIRSNQFRLSNVFRFAPPVPLRFLFVGKNEAHDDGGFVRASLLDKID